MSDNSKQLGDTGDLAHTCFTLGYRLPMFREGILWLEGTDTFDSRRPAMIRALDLPEHFLHPYQGVPSIWNRERRRKVLEDLLVVSNAVESLDNFHSESKLRPIRSLLSDFAIQFDQLDQLEDKNSPDNQKFYDEVDKSWMETARSKLETTILTLVKESEDWITHIRSMIPANCHVPFELGTQSAALRAEIGISASTLDTISNTEIEHWQRQVRQIADRADGYTLQPVSRELTSSEFSREGVERLLDELVHNIDKCLRETTQQYTAMAAELHSFPTPPNSKEPENPEEWETFAKSRIMVCGIEIHLTASQQRLVLARLMYNPTQWKSANDITLVDQIWAEDEETATKRISSVISKLENKLAEQLGVSFEKGKTNQFMRPIQRRPGTYIERNVGKPPTKGAEYRIDEASIRKLPRS
jgi:hypothetical protein